MLAKIWPRRLGWLTCLTVLVALGRVFRIKHKNMWRNSEEIRYLPQPSNNSHSGIAMNRPKWWFSNGEDGEWPN